MYLQEMRGRKREILEEFTEQGQGSDFGELTKAKYLPQAKDYSSFTLEELTAEVKEELALYQSVLRRVSRERRAKKSKPCTTLAVVRTRKKRTDRRVGRGRNRDNPVAEARRKARAEERAALFPEERQMILEVEALFECGVSKDVRTAIRVKMLIKLRELAGPVPRMKLRSLFGAHTRWWTRVYLAAKAERPDLFSPRPRGHYKPTRKYDPARRHAKYLAHEKPKRTKSPNLRPQGEVLLVLKTAAIREVLSSGPKAKRLVWAIVKGDYKVFCRAWDRAHEET